MKVNNSMNDSGQSSNHPLGTVLWSFRREFLAVAVFSMVVNLLMLTPTLYMLQVYDRVMVSLNEMTLLIVSLITLFFFRHDGVCGMGPVHDAGAHRGAAGWRLE